MFSFPHSPQIRTLNDKQAASTLPLNAIVIKNDLIFLLCLFWIGSYNSCCFCKKGRLNWHTSKYFRGSNIGKAKIHCCKDKIAFTKYLYFAFGGKIPLNGKIALPKNLVPPFLFLAAPVQTGSELY